MDRSKNDTLLKILYLNGTTAKATVDLEIREKRYEEFTAVLRELTGYEGALKLYGKEEQLAQKICILLPGANFRSGACSCFPSQDAALIRQDYIQTFSLRQITGRRNGADGNGSKRFSAFFHEESITKIQ